MLRCLAAAPVILLALCSGLLAVEPQKLAEALTFYADFEGTGDAAFAKGDKQLYTSPTVESRQPKPGLHAAGAALVPGGKFGGALKFGQKAPEAVMFQAAENMPYQKSDWNGTVSLWLSLDPDKDLEPGYADPLQITERGWNDGSFFVDFTKDDTPRHFRLGAFADRKVWDPKEADWETVPVAERPMVELANPIFGRGRWTHVAFTFESFNTGQPNGAATLYIDGQPQGTLAGRKQTYTWDPAKSAIMLGLSYVGLIDDLAIFDRALTGEEIKTLYELPEGAAGLHRPSR
jgi:hypothetical protein